MTFHAVDSRSQNFPTKKALKEAVKNGDTVWFRDTSFINSMGTLSVVDAIEATEGGTRLYITGPHPGVSAKWYATVEHDPKNGIKIT
jgi:hypothetical protein